jgi:hypothetical protein
MRMPQPLERSLFVFPDYFFADARQSLMPVPMPLTTPQIRFFLTGTLIVESVFERFGFREPSGEYIIITMHAFRRFLITAAAMSDLEIEQLQQWTKHSSKAALRAYIRPTQYEMAKKTFAAFTLTGTDKELDRS